MAERLGCLVRNKVAFKFASKVTVRRFLVILVDRPPFAVKLVELLLVSHHLQVFGAGTEGMLLVMVFAKLGTETELLIPVVVVHYSLVGLVLLN